MKIREKLFVGIPTTIQPGATFALVAPAGTFSPEDFEISKKKIHSLGYNTTYSEKIWHRRKDVCGDEWERAFEIIEFMKSPSVDALWCIRGGYGSSQILSWLPHCPIYRKPLIGYSDISFLHFFIHSFSETLSFHAPNFIELSSMDAGRIGEILETFQNPMSFKWSFKSSQVIRHGTAYGKLIGGNLTCLTHLLGTHHIFPEVFREAILFVEDVNERPYRIDRMFVHLKDAGVLQEIGALLLGHFTNCGTDHEELWERILRICKPFNFPIVKGFPAGHTKTQECIPMGLEASLNTYQGILCFGADS